MSKVAKKGKKTGDDHAAEIQQLAVSQIQLEGAMKATEAMKSRCDADIKEYAIGIRKCQDRIKFLSPTPPE